MDAASFVFGFLAGGFFSLVLSNFLAKKVGEAVLQALEGTIKGEVDGDKEREKTIPANWWKKGKYEE